MNTKYSPSYRQGNLFRPVKREQGEGPETNYRALSGLAVVSVILGGLSVLTFAGWMLSILQAAGIAIGLIALRRIDRNSEEMTGKNVALAGILLSVIFFAGGAAWMLIPRTPAGYQWVDFKELQPNPDDPMQIVSEKAENELADRTNPKILITGYMTPTRQKAGLREFVIVNDPGSCSFCNPNPKPTEMIFVKLGEGLRMEYRTNAVDVGGVLKINKAPSPATGGTVYMIEADFIR
jgi:hypothetical protein